MALARILIISTTAIFSTQSAFAFSPTIFRGPSAGIVSSTKSSNVDLTIEYDSAAKLAYNQWREEYDKGDFDEDRYDAFKANYETLTILNVVAAKEARESGEARRRLKLNEFADAVSLESTTESPNVDVTIEYDSAAKLAYNQWRVQYNKGDFDEERYDVFKANYETLTISNVVAAKEARESGEVCERLDLDESADTVIYEIEAATESPNVDVTIEYDSAAKLAYDQWRVQYNKGDFDEERYDVFKANYETLTISNVVAAKEARESGEVCKRLDLNEFADFTVEEYMAIGKEATNSIEETIETSNEASPLGMMETIMESSAAQNEATNAIEEANAAVAEEEQKLAEKLGLESVEELETAMDAMDGIAEDGGELNLETTNSIEETIETSDEASPLGMMETIMESSAAQNEATNAIEEANAAVAEEEQKLAEKLGLESVEELETAMDAMDGIAEDGGELDPENISLDIDVRSAYINWCKEYGKETDESRYPNFMFNYLTMDQLAKESSKTMELNMYADYTEEEFVALRSKEESTVDMKAEKVPEPKIKNEVATETNTDAATEVNAEEEVAVSNDEAEAVTKAKAKEEAAIAKARAKVEEDAAIAKVEAKEEAIIAEARAKDVEAEAKIREEAAFENNEAAVEKAKAKEEAAIASAKAKIDKDAAITEAKAKEEAIIAEGKAKERAAAVELAKEDAAVEAKKMEDTAAEAKKTKEEAVAKVEAKAKEAEAAKVKVQEANKKKVAADGAKAAEVAKAAADEQGKRRSAQAKVLADAEAAAEAASIAGAKEMAEKDAVREAKRRELDELGKEITLKQAREAEEKLARDKLARGTITFPSKPVPEVALKRDTPQKAPPSKQSPKPALKKIVPATEEKPRSVFASKPAMKKLDSSEDKAPSRPLWLKLIKKAQNVDDDVSPQTKRPTSTPVRKSAVKTKPPSVKAKSASPISARTKQKAVPVDKSPENPKKFQFFQSSVAKKQATPAKKKAAATKTKKAPALVQKKSTIPVAKKAPVPTQKKSWGTFTIKAAQGKGNKFGVKTKPATTATKKTVGKKESFMFFGSKPKSEKASKIPAPSNADTPARKNSWGTFNIKSAQKAQAKPKVDPAPAQKSGWGTFNIKSAQKAQAKPKADPAPAQKSGWGTFNIKSAQKAQAKPKADPAPARKSGWGTFNIKSAQKAQAKPKAADVPVRKSGWGTFNIKSAQKAQAKPKTATPARKSGRGTVNIKSSKAKQTKSTSTPVPNLVSEKEPFSFFKSKPRKNAEPNEAPKKKQKFAKPAKLAPKDGIPVINNWEREADGSITGQISNSPNFRDGESITTSPARGVAKAGRVVVTGSGSKYRLM